MSGCLPQLRRFRKAVAILEPRGGYDGSLAQLSQDPAHMAFAWAPNATYDPLFVATVPLVQKHATQLWDGRIDPGLLVHADEGLVDRGSSKPSWTGAHRPLGGQIPLLAQTTFGPLISPLLTRPLLVQTTFGPDHFLAVSGLCKSGAPKGGAPKGVAPNSGVSKGGGCQKFRVFSLSRHIFLSFFLSWGVLSCCFTQQPENSKRAHLRVPALQTPPKFHENTPRETQKERNGGGRGKKARNFGPPTLRGPTLRLHKPETAKKRSGPKVVRHLERAKSGHLFGPFGRSKIGPKVVWAKSGLGQKWSRQVWPKNRAKSFVWAKSGICRESRSSCPNCGPVEDRGCRSSRKARPMEKGRVCTPSSSPVVFKRRATATCWGETASGQPV